MPRPQSRELKDEMEALPPKVPDEPWQDGWPQTHKAFEAFVEAFKDRLVWYAFRRLGDFHEAEDAIQEVFLKVYAARDRRREVLRVEPYLYRMAANACTDRFRKRKTRPPVISIEEVKADHLPDARPSALEQAAAREELCRIEQLLARLPRRHGEVLRLRVLDELSMADIAQTLGCSLAAVKSRLRDGLKKLRKWVTQEGEESR